MRLAASAWGSPEERGTGILYTWDATRVFIERAAALTDYHPLILDDAKRARRPEGVGRTLYDYASGVGRGRGSPQGIQRTTRAHGVLLSTGEAPATSFTNDGGTRARTLCLWGSSFGGAKSETEAAVRGINAAVVTHFGHAGPLVARWLLDTPEAAVLARGEYDAQLAAWTKLANGNPVASRAAGYVAALAVARRVLHEVLGVPEPASDPLVLAWDAVIKASFKSDRPADALRDVLSWATGQQHRFWGRIEGEPGTDDPPGAGWLGAWSRSASWSYLAVLPTELRGFLERQKYDVEAVDALVGRSRLAYPRGRAPHRQGHRRAGEAALLRHQARGRRPRRRRREGVATARSPTGPRRVPLVPTRPRTGLCAFVAGARAQCPETPAPREEG